VPIRQVARYKTMDDAEFKRRLSEVAEWRYEPERDNFGRLKGPGSRGPKKTKEPEEQNLTRPIELVSVRRSCNCTDCGQHCPNGRTTVANYYQGRVKGAWREKCQTCGKFQDPNTGEFKLQGGHATHTFNKYINGTYEKMNLDFRVSNKIHQPMQGNNDMQTHIEDSKCVIRVHQDFSQSDK